MFVQVLSDRKEILKKTKDYTDLIMYKHAKSVKYKL